MLPAPVTLARRGFLRHPCPPRSLPKLLRAPARLTNLSALLIIALTSFSLLLNFRLYSQTRNVPLPRSIVETLPTRPPTVEGLDHLVIVPGHAIWIGALSEDAEVEDSWLLAQYQKGRGRPSIFRAHISRGSEIATEDPRALLVFSGCSPTPPRSLVPPIRGHTSPYSATSEGESYLRFARATGLLPPTDMFARVTTEDAALDSFQNLLFSIARFREITGAYPTRITVVGHSFKRHRFERLHRHALRWPKLRFKYEGVPLGNETAEYEAASGEVRSSSSVCPFLLDAVSQSLTSLVQKRAGRNFHMRSHGYHVGAPELRQLFEWCPEDGRKLFSGTLPWAKK